MPTFPHHSSKYGSADTATVLEMNSSSNPTFKISPPMSKLESRKRKSSVGEINGGSAMAPKRPKICLRTVLEASASWRVDAWRVILFATNSKTGGTADIARGTVLDTVIHSVAVKKFRFSNDATRRVQVSCFTNELSMLSELSHDNIIKLVGFVEHHDGAIPWILLPWEANGNLREFVQSQDWAIPERLSLIYDVASGVDYLHSRNPPVCHGDLKSLNILVNPENRAVITDFGSAHRVGRNIREGKVNTSITPVRFNAERSKNRSKARPLFEVEECGTIFTLTGPCYTLRWAAPEVLEEERFGLASDVWAFGWICWETMTGNIPFDDLHGEVSIILSVTRGDLPLVTSNEHISQVRALCTLMTGCWAMDPTERPTAKECRRNMGWMSKITPSRKGIIKSPEKRSAQLLCALGYVNLTSGKGDEARHCFQDALNIGRSANGNVFVVASAALGLGKVCAIQRNYNQAEEWYNQAREIYAEIGYQRGIADAAREVADLHRIQNNYAKAKASYIEARDIYKHIEDQRGVAAAILGLGTVHRLRKEYAKAEALYNEARKIYSRSDDQEGLAHATWELGQVHRLWNGGAEAGFSSNETREIDIQADSRPGGAVAPWELGAVYRFQDEYAKAEASYDQAWAGRIPTWLAYQQDLAVKSRRLGDFYYYDKGDRTEAEASYNRALEVYTQLGDQEGIASVEQQLKMISPVEELPTVSGADNRVVLPSFMWGRTPK